MWWIALLIGCNSGPVNPDWIDQHDAIALWQQGKEALDAGDTTLALKQFEAARQRRPDDALLIAWLAQAQAAKGDLQQAVHTLDQALLTEPKMVEARYNRAAWLARMGDHLGAAQGLAPLVLSGEIDAKQVREDADFSDALAGPFFEFLPHQTLMLEVKPPGERAFWGSQIDLVWTVKGASPGPLLLALPVQGPAAPVALVEDQSALGRTVTLTVKVVGAGTILFGPGTLNLDDTPLSADSVAVEAIAPDDKTTPSSIPPVLAIAPSSLQVWMPTIGAKRVDADLWIRLSPADRVVFEGADEDRVRYELRADGQPVARWYRYPSLADKVEHVLIRRGTEVIWEGPALASPPPGG